jgi:hypothetical protein
MIFSTEILISLLSSLGAGLGAYAAIRADLARLHERATAAAKRADEAHARIDVLLGQDRRHT